jgi:hypothetical protein
MDIVENLKQSSPTKHTWKMTYSSDKTARQGAHMILVFVDVAYGEK